MIIEPGATLTVRTATGAPARVRALSGVTEGRDFPVVWVCTEDDYEAAQAGDESVRIPWPLDAVADAVGT